RSVGQNRHARRAERHSGADSASTLSLMIDMLRLMPHGLQGQLRAPPYQIWSAMRAEGFVTQPSDVILNHGVELTGIWNVVGILDAVPSPMVTLIEDDGSAPEGNVHSLVGNTAIAIQPLARQFLGRPEGAFGVTPLLILREVTR
ncbi:MAG: hypothetical protein ACJ8AS_09670, partial [Hyphomicrobiales bacterium]